MEDNVDKRESNKEIETQRGNMGWSESHRLCVRIALEPKNLGLLTSRLDPS